MSKIKKLSAVMLLLTLLTLPMKADGQGAETCGGTDTTQASAYVPVPSGEGPIYARAGRTEDAVRAQLYFQAIGPDSMGQCILLGEQILTTEAWKPIGQARSLTGQKSGNLILALSTSDYSQAGASSPMVVFASATPPCKLAADCKVTYQGKEFNLSPRKLSMSTDTLRVGQLLPIADETVQEVIYSVDGRQVHKSNQLEEFNTRYVPGGKHLLERTVVLASGQSLSDSREYEHGALGEPFYLLTSSYNRFSKIFNFAGILLGLWLVWILGFTAAKLIHRRRQWRLNHIAGLRNATSKRTRGLLDGSTMDAIRGHYKAVAIGTGLLASLWLGYSFVLSSFIVDGASMYPTLEDRSRHPLFILPATVGKVTGAGYTPDRGKIVVVKKAEHNLFDTALTEQASYVVKRVVGLPGDRVVVRDGVIRIFNADHPEGFVPDEEYDWIRDRTGSEYFRTDVILRDNELFVVGDNRDESIDSRFYGPVSTSDVVGTML